MTLEIKEIADWDNRRVLIAEQGRLCFEGELGPNAKITYLKDGEEITESMQAFNERFADIKKGDVSEIAGKKVVTNAKGEIKPALLEPVSSKGFWGKLATRVMNCLHRVK